ncbi:hypothetical protein [Peribacillus acanthi]|uniref:hypothetical protein n=1 Tax=Peribacillus acanthi TaxID=2171554 RepID=UPI000D3EBEF5|nr:hypothetical protein [Peribacillus acanthi]
MKKIILGIIVVFTMFSTGINHAEAAASTYYCSDVEYKCIGIKFTSWGTNMAESASIYIPYGAKVLISGSTEDNSLFSMSFYPIDSNGASAGPLVGVAPFGGGDWTEYTNTKAGYYRVRGLCGDSSDQERCVGLGTISFYTE